MAGTMINTQDGKPVTKDNPLPVALIGGGGTPEPGSIKTDMIADGAITDEKLAKPKVDVPPSLVPKKVIGTTLETSELGLVGYDDDPTPMSLVMRQFGGQVATAAPVADTDAATKKYVDDNKPAAMSSAEATTGTATTARSISAQVLTAGAKAAMKNKTEIAALTAIADPATATAQDIATKLNEVIAALKA